MADARPTAPHFGAIAGSYDRLRPADDRWWQIFDVLVAAGDLAGRRTLDVGCGTGTLAVALAELGGKVWGIDSSPEMLAQAEAKETRARFKEARGEALPFKDGWFERVVMRLSLHHLERQRALAEAERVLVPGGRLVIATFDPAHFTGYWLNELFPSVARIDEVRFPDADTLTRELGEAGFEGMAIARVSQPGKLSRTEALERIRGRYISTLHLIDESEFERGLAAAEAGLGEEIEHVLEWLVVSAQKPALDVVRTHG